MQWFSAYLLENVSRKLRHMNKLDPVTVFGISPGYLKDHQPGIITVYAILSISGFCILTNLLFNFLCIFDVITGDVATVLIRFICDPSPSSSTSDITPRLISDRSERLIFDISTSLGCPAATVDCQAFDSVGNKYDLSPLTKTSGFTNWVTSDGRNKYYFNVCRSVTRFNNETNCLGLSKTYYPQRFSDA